MEDRERLKKRLLDLHRDLHKARNDADRLAILSKIEDVRELLRAYDYSGNGLPQTREGGAV